MTKIYLNECQNYGHVKKTPILYILYIFRTEFAWVYTLQALQIIFVLLVECIPKKIQFYIYIR
jgi:hypothetical protein